MTSPSILVDETARLAALDRYAILDTSPEEAFDDVVRLASMICGTPIALISLIDSTRQWFKARVGMHATETPRENAFCRYAMEQNDVFLVPDAVSDLRFSANPLVVGEPYIRFYAGAPLTTPEGLSLGTVCVLDRKPRTLTDEQLTALRVLARQVMVQLELRRMIVERNIAASELRIERDGLERMKKDFISTVSHELRTPLTSIRGSLGLLASGVMGELPEEAKSMVAVAERNSMRLISIINDILDFDKLHGGTMEMDMRPVSLQQVLEQAIEATSAAALQEGVLLELREGEGRVLGDAMRLAQVGSNLLSNAVKYSPRGGTVVASVIAVEGTFEVRIEDRGIGIAPQLQGRLFRRFERADSSDARTKPGTGLGLSIAKAIVERHGGTIGVESREGEGSTFWFRLPAAGDYADLLAARAEASS